MRKRSEARPAGPEPKPSAAERTVPLFSADDARCPACGDRVALSKVTVRDDGTPECPSCGAPLPKTVQGADVETPEAPRSRDVEVGAGPARAPDAERPPRATQPLPRVYCNECGAEWPRVDERPFPNCGHTDGMVDHPSKSIQYNPPAGHAFQPELVKVKDAPARARTPQATPRPEAAPPPPGPAAGEPGAVTLRQENGTLVVEWGKINFMVAQHSSLGVGPFSLSAAVVPGQDAAEVAGRILADLRQIATNSFRMQLAWYEEQLGIINRK